MDYEKKYKEALKKARQLYAYPTTKPFISDLQDIFPELVESEDERMWKLIKKYAHSNISDMALDADHITREQLESWLEKKCEQKPAQDRYMEGYLNGTNDALKTLKPAAWSEEDEQHKRQILRILKDNGCSQTLQERTEKWIEERLKSFRPQSHWKPSENELEVLRLVAEKDGTCLMGLYENLKKLMED